MRRRPGTSWPSSRTSPAPSSAAGGSPTPQPAPRRSCCASMATASSAARRSSWTGSDAGPWGWNGCERSARASWPPTTWTSSPKRAAVRRCSSGSSDGCDGPGTDWSTWTDWRPVGASGSRSPTMSWNGSGRRGPLSRPEPAAYIAERPGRLRSTIKRTTQAHGQGWRRHAAGGARAGGRGPRHPGPAPRRPLGGRLRVPGRLAGVPARRHRGHGDRRGRGPRGRRRRGDGHRHGAGPGHGREGGVLPGGSIHGPRLAGRRIGPQGRRDPLGHRVRMHGVRPAAGRRVRTRPTGHRSGGSWSAVRFGVGVGGRALAAGGDAWRRALPLVQRSAEHWRSLRHPAGPEATPPPT